MTEEMKHPDHPWQKVPSPGNKKCRQCNTEASLGKVQAEQRPDNGQTILAAIWSCEVHA